MIVSVVHPITPLVSIGRRLTDPPRTATAIAVAQEEVLTRLMQQLAPTVLGKRFALRGMDAATFRSVVPVLRYADLAPEITRVAAGEADVLFKGPAVALAQTSGTTRSADAGERYVPQSRALLAHHRKGGMAALARVMDKTPGVIGGRMLMLGGCTALDRRGPVPIGDLSGICAAGIPPWIRWAYEPGRAIADEPDWERRLGLMVEHLRHRDVRLVSGIPAWLLMLFDRLGVRAASAWPRLQAMIHGGHGIEPFIATLAAQLDGGTWMQEVYPASEAFIAVGQAPWRLGDGKPAALELLTDHGVYLEFQQDDGAIVGAHALAAGGIYRVLVTTPGGLLRYELGDLVRAEGPGVIRVAGRIRTRISVFGEHVEGMALAEALATATATTGATVAHYHVAPQLPTASEPRGAHEWWIEFVAPPSDALRFTTTIDNELRRLVIDYAAHRDGGQLLMPVLFPVPSGTFHAYLSAKGHLGGQHKVPQAWPDHSIADQLLSATSAAATAATASANLRKV